VGAKALCPICGHDDWCCIGDVYINCMRIESKRASVNGGWLHPLDKAAKLFIQARRVKPVVLVDCPAIWRAWKGKGKLEDVDELAAELGVSPLALDQLGCVVSPEHDAYAFPMRDAAGNVIGIRLRTRTGKKFAVTGSRSGIFWRNGTYEKTLYVVEGPTDCAAAMTIGLCAIGRPSCLGCEEFVTSFIHRKKIREVIIVADNDLPGLRGAEKLQSMLTVKSLLWTPPCKDLREYVKNGGTKATIKTATKDLIWKNP
jgi:hypothetical protein